MKSKKIISILVSILFAVLSAYADNPDYYHRAEKAFSEGNYEKAFKLYQAEYVLTGTNVEIKIKMCLDCIADKETAEKAAEAGNIERAKMFYEYVLERNPNDKLARDFIQSHMIPEWQNDCWIISLGNNEFLAVQKSIGEKMTYENAMDNAKANRLGGFSDWRLPVVDEIDLITKDFSVQVSGNYWVLDTKVQVSSSAELHNGNHLKTKISHKHTSSYISKNDCAYVLETREVVDEWEKTDNVKKPLSVHELEFLKVRKFKDDGVVSTEANIKPKTKTRNREVKGTAKSSLKVETTVSRSSYCK